LLNQAAATAPVEDCRCAVCGAPLTPRGFEARQVHTQLGVVTLRRRYYTCPAEHGGYAPMDQQLALVGQWSAGMQEWMQYVSAKDSFAGGAECIALFSGQVAAPSSIRAVAEWHGARKEAAQQKEIAERLQRRQEPPRTPAPARLYVAVDGAHVPERGEWKECKVGVVFETSARLPLRVRWREYVAAIEPMAQFGERLYTVAQRHGVEHAAELVVLGDGAPAIWELASMHYPQATQILDFYHASEHLHAVRALAWPADDPHGERWTRAQIVRLKRGWWDAFIAAFAALPPLSGKRDQALRYFLNNRARMQYRAYRARLLFIGSGIVESACKQVVTRRMKITGARWLHPGAQAIIQIRVAYLNGAYCPRAQIRLAA